MTPHCYPAHFCTFSVCCCVFLRSLLLTSKSLPPQGFFRTGSFAELRDGEKGFEVKNAFLKFTTSENVTLKGTGLFVVNGAVANEITINGNGKEQCVAVNSTNAEIAISYSVGDVDCKSLSKKIEAQKIYNLGELKAPKAFIRGSFNSWSTTDNQIVMFEENGWYVAKNVNFAANTYFKFVDKDTNTWIGGYTDFAVNKNMYFGTSDIKVPSAGKYDIYFAPLKGLYYAVSAGSAAPSVPTGQYIYLHANVWTDSNANIFCYMWNNSGNAWAKATATHDKVYIYEIPSNYSSFKFVRKNSTDSSFSWNNVWNESANLTKPTTVKIMYFVWDNWTVNASQWDVVNK